MQRAYRTTLTHFLTGHCPNGMPKGLWEMIRMPKWLILVAGSLLGFVGTVGVLQILSLNTTGGLLKWTSPKIMVGLSALQIAAIAVLWITPKILQRRCEARIHMVDYAVCLNCGYFLTGLPETHHCPECGSKYESRQLKETWKSFLYI